MTEWAKVSVSGIGVPVVIGGKCVWMFDNDYKETAESLAREINNALSAVAVKRDDVKNIIHDFVSHKDQAEVYKALEAL